MTQLVDSFEARVRTAVEECHRLGYHPNHFQQMLESSSAVQLAQRLAISGSIQTGLKRLAGLGRLDLSIESIMLEPEFDTLFSQQVLGAARWHLDQARGS